jgi:hypothetical protein
MYYHHFVLVQHLPMIPFSDAQASHWVQFRRSALIRAHPLCSLSLTHPFMLQFVMIILFDVV